MIRNKMVLMSIFVDVILFGMNCGDCIEHVSGRYYAQAGDPYLHRGLFIKQMAYPVFVMQTRDNKQQNWFNFERPIKSIQWDSTGKYVLYVILHDDKMHKFNLQYLQCSQ